jgi:hypothetical protein
MTKHDSVNNPAHYVSHPSGVECIQITEHMGFNLGNAIKYIWRADLKADALEDLRKAAWYLGREIDKREGDPKYRKADYVPGFSAGCDTNPYAWQPWVGGEKAPVPKGAIVDIKWRQGATSYGLEAGHMNITAPHVVEWEHIGSRYDIMAWRLSNLPVDTWQPWGGGDMPVPKGTLIDVQYRGRRASGVEAGGTHARRWTRENKYGDITAWRLAETKPTMPHPWIMWQGGEMPVPKGTLVDVQHRDGEVFKAVPAGLAMRSAWTWRHAGVSGDIIGYRLAE